MRPRSSYQLGTHRDPSHHTLPPPKTRFSNPSSLYFINKMEKKLCVDAHDQHLRSPNKTVLILRPASPRTRLGHTQ